MNQPEKTQEGRIAKTISMFDEWDIVDFINKENGFSNRSVAMRYIVNQFKHYREQEGRPIVLAKEKK